jgi:Kef-type K+ transport system membrane component KefB
VSHQDVAALCLQVAVLLAAALLAGHAARRAGLPLVVGELLAGVLLGPTLLATLAPDLLAGLFPPGPTAIGRDAITKLGMLCFLFAAGLELDVPAVWRLGRSVAAASVLGIVVPFACGAALAWAAPALVGAEPHEVPRMAVFLGTALAISALPVIARILMDLDLHRSPVGSVVLAAATIDDLVGWSLFGALLGRMGGGSGRSGAATVAVVILLAAAALAAGRWAAARARPWVRAHIRTPGGLVAAAAILTRRGASAGEAGGLHATLGAFLAGAMLSRQREEKEGPYLAVHEFALGVFAPIYFVSVGLKADFVASFDAVLVAAVFVVACVGKLVGVTLGARLGGMAPREALAVAFGMNARGAMEMVLAALALEAGLIDSRMFVALVVMAVGTSVLSGPMMTRLLRSAPRAA